MTTLENSSSEPAHYLTHLLRDCFPVWDWAQGQTTVLGAEADGEVTHSTVYSLTYLFF